MKSFKLSNWVLAGWLLAVGCNRPGAATADATGAQPTATESAAADSPENQPQPKLPTMKLWLGPKSIAAEIASTSAQWQKGMMFRTNVTDQEGMLFVFPRPAQQAFWMHNTLIPLYCAYIDSEGVILEIHDMVPRDENPIKAATDQVQYVLETQKGWFEKNQVKVGVAVATERGSLKETFFGKR